MRGVNLDVFAFDYDLTWAAFFLSADETIYGRFGGRDAESAEKYLSLAGLKHALRAALIAHRKAPREKPPSEAKPARTVEQYAAAKKLRDSTCIHCHQVYDFRREELKAAKKWSLDEVWVYPLPQNVGLTLDPDRGDRIKSVLAKSAADRTGLRAGDTLKSLGGVPVASFADAQYALHLASSSGRVAVTWERDGKECHGDLELPDGWRKTDISWRQSMWGLEPPPGVVGRDLGSESRKRLDLSEKALAVWQGDYLTPAAKAAGLRAGDVVVGVDGKSPEMTMAQFNAYVRTTYKVGDKVTYNILRDGKRVDVPLTLPAREP
jgi:membrane-associated protease RseP (regulator of RpoE activity)